MDRLAMILEAGSKSPDAAQIMKEWDDIVVAHANKLKEVHPEMYKRFVEDFYVSVYGEHLCESSAMQAVSCMKNVDGTTGAHWSIAETDSAASQHGISWSHFNRYDWYYVMNMMYSDFYQLFGSSTETYIKLAKAWLNDPDVDEGKAYRYYQDVVL